MHQHVMWWSNIEFFSYWVPLHNFRYFWYNTLNLELVAFSYQEKVLQLTLKMKKLIVAVLAGLVLNFSARAEETIAEKIIAAKAQQELLRAQVARLENPTILEKSVDLSVQAKNAWMILIDAIVSKFNKKGEK